MKMFKEQFIKLILISFTVAFIYSCSSGSHEIKKLSTEVDFHIEQVDTDGVHSRNSIAEVHNSETPFSPSMFLDLHVPKTDSVSLFMYSLTGLPASKVYKTVLAKGNYLIKPMIPDLLKSGVYYVRITVDTASVVRKVMFLR